MSLLEIENLTVEFMTASGTTPSRIEPFAHRSRVGRAGQWGSLNDARDISK